MQTELENSIEYCMAKRHEKNIFLLERRVEDGVFRYAVGESDHPEPLYSIYAEYSLYTERSVGSIPAFSDNREHAERFCALLERFLATPLSLDALYEDSLTP